MLDQKIKDWNKLKKLTIEKGYFDIPSKFDSEVDRLLSEYNQKYSEPFNLLKEPQFPKYL